MLLTYKGDSLVEEYAVSADFSFFVYIIVMTSLAVLLMLVLVILLELKMNRIMYKLDNMSRDAGRFMKLGLKFFRTRSDR